MPKKLHNLCKCQPRNIQTIQCVNILCKAVNNLLSNESGHDTRIWYHKTAPFKGCPQAPLSFFLAPIPRSARTLYPPWEPVHRLGLQGIVVRYTAIIFFCMFDYKQHEKTSNDSSGTLLQV